MSTFQIAVPTFNQAASSQHALGPEPLAAVGSTPLVTPVTTCHDMHSTLVKVSCTSVSTCLSSHTISSSPDTIDKCRAAPSQSWNGADAYFALSVAHGLRTDRRLMHRVQLRRLILQVSLRSCQCGTTMTLLRCC